MLLIKGTMSAISAGMLIYAATVEMITGNFVLVVSTVVMDMDMDISIILIRGLAIPVLTIMIMMGNIF
jgi:hypothetical protein